MVLERGAGQVVVRLLWAFGHFLLRTVFAPYLFLSPTALTTLVGHKRDRSNLHTRFLTTSSVETQGYKYLTIRILHGHQKNAHAPL
jgi:hypothetical protein